MNRGTNSGQYLEARPTRTSSIAAYMSNTIDITHMACNLQHLHKKQNHSTNFSMAQFSVSHEVRLVQSQIALNGLAKQIEAIF